MSRAEDLEVIQACRHGAPEKYRVLVEKYQGRLFGMVYGVVLDRGIAEDVVQEAFIKGFRSLNKFRGDSGFYTWIYRIARNLAIDALRRRKPEFSYDDAMEVSPVRVSEAFERADIKLKKKELWEKVKIALQSLSEEHRVILVLREWEGLSYKQIAQRTDCSLGTVMSRLHYAREKMAALLKPYLSGEGDGYGKL